MLPTSFWKMGCVRRHRQKAGAEKDVWVHDRPMHRH